MSLSSQLNLSARGTLSTTGFDPLTIGIAWAGGLTDGVGLGQANVVYRGVISVPNGAPVSLDLNGGGLTQPNGAAANFVKLAAVIVFNDSTTAGEVLTVGGGTNAVANVSGTVGPGGIFVLYEPSLAALPVTAGTGDILKFTSASGTISVRVLLLGRSA